MVNFKPVLLTLTKKTLRIRWQLWSFSYILDLDWFMSWLLRPAKNISSRLETIKFLLSSRLHSVISTIVCYLWPRSARTQTSDHDQQSIVIPTPHLTKPSSAASTSPSFSTHHTKCYIDACYSRGTWCQSSSWPVWALRRHSSWSSFRLPHDRKWLWYLFLAPLIHTRATSSTTIWWLYYGP